MYQQAGLYFYKFRFLLASILTATFLMLISALVTAVGSNTILAHPSTSAFDISAQDSPNMVTDGASVLVANTQGAMLSTGSTVYGTCRSITNMTARSGRFIVHSSAATVGSTVHGTTFLAHGVGSITMHTLHATGSGILFTLHMPGRIVGSVTHEHTVTSLIKPADDESVPVISAETSAAVLATFNAKEQQEIAQWQAAQLEANHSLDGTIVAGDPTHGGYPATWADAPQDSMLDSWGMYNRECVSYAAWKVYQTYGYMPYWGGVGNANQWVGDAQRAGIPTGSTPRVHSVAIWMHGYYGHAMWVEQVSGNMIYVSQYNYSLNGQYSEMWVNGSDFTYIYFK
jgi:surface antigen